MLSIRKGSSGSSVEAWQNFLLGLGLYSGEVDGKFGPLTEEATKKFQSRNALNIDGWVGTSTYAAAMIRGFDPLCYLEGEQLDRSSPAWPRQPGGIAPMSVTQKNKLFGPIGYVSAGNDRDPEAIRITNGWESNVELVELPQLVGCGGAPKSGKIWFHKKATKQLVALFDAWNPHKHLILTFAGSWVPRLVRGSRTTLSSHAWGIAFDINAQWNSLGSRPALVGSMGSVRELAEIATEFGFFWGGWFPNRPDGMHFELARLDS